MDNEPQILQDEQAQEMAALQAMANAGQNEQPQNTNTDMPPAVDVNIAGEVSTLLSIVVGVASPMFPSLQKIYTPETVEQVGKVLEPVCLKHGWLQNGVGGKWQEEIVAAAVLVPLAVATRNAISADNAERNKTKDQGAIFKPDKNTDGKTGTSQSITGGSKNVVIGGVVAA